MLKYAKSQNMGLTGKLNEMNEKVKSILYALFSNNVFF